MIHAHHHSNFSFGMRRSGDPVDDAIVSTSSEVITRELSDEEWEQAMARVVRKRTRFTGRNHDNPYIQSEGDETPHGTF